MLLVTAGRSRQAAEAKQGHRGRRPAGAPGRLSSPKPRPCRERSMAVSPDDRLEDEDTLPQWLPGSSGCHSWSPPVASKDTTGRGLARGHRPPRDSEGTCPSLLALLSTCPRARGWPLPSIWLPGAPLQAPAGPPPWHADCLLSGAGSAFPWLPVPRWRGPEAPRATLGGLAELVPGPAEHWGPPGVWLGETAPGGGGPGPQAGSSAMVSRLHREEKGWASAGRGRGRCQGCPRGSRPLHVLTAAPTLPPPLRCCWGKRWAWAHRQGPPGAGAAQGPRAAGPRYLALSRSQSLTRKAAWGQKGEEGGQRRAGAGRGQTDARLGGYGGGAGGWPSFQHALPGLGL